MPDVKISALPTASIVGLSDIFVLNQGGVTKTASKSLVISGLATTDQIGGLNSAQVQSLTSAQIAAITPATIGALSTDAASGFATTSQVVGIAYTSQLSAFATTDQISGFTNSAQVQSLTSAQISAITAASIGAASTSQLSAYVPKTGATMEGKLIMAATTAQAFANIGSALSGVAAPASTVGGDVWVSNQSRLTFSPLTGTAVTLAGLSQANTFNQAQTIGVGGVVTALAVLNNGTGRAATFGAASASTAVSILQTGAGEAFRVEDETSPDATPFVISGTGRVGIGVAPDAVTALSVDSGGIKFADGSIATTALGGAGGLNSAQIQALTTEQLNAISVSAGAGLTGGGALSASSTLSIAALSPDPTGTYGSTSQIPSLTVNNLGQVTAASSLAMPSTLVNIYSTVGASTWTKPAGAKLVVFDVLAGGGGGGAGGKAASGTAVFGGGGGGGGGRNIVQYDGSDLADSTYTITIGAGGTGGVQGGAAAVSGGISTVSGATNGIIARSIGGGGGGVGGTANGGAGGGGNFFGNTGGNPNITGQAGTGGASNPGGAGGGAGGGISTTTPFDAGNGASSITYQLAGGTGGIASTTANGTNGTNGLTKSGVASGVLIGSGGGGGGASRFATGSGGDGGNGAGYGTGGGGGGATNGTGNGGTGGDGAPGIVLVTTYF